VKQFKNILSVIAVTIAVMVTLSGCGKANTAKEASKAGIKTANYASTTISTLEDLDIPNFSFPNIFGTDFFQKNNTTQAYSLQNHVMQPQSMSTYKTRHYEANTLNVATKGRSEYIAKLDSLYALCADIVAANEKCKATAAELVSQAAQTNALAQELRTAKPKADFTAFNNANNEANKSIARVHKDRGLIARHLSFIPTTSDNINVDDMTTQYLSVLNRLDKRLNILCEAAEDVSDLNKILRTLLGKNEPVAQESNPSEFSNEVRKVRRSPLFKKTITETVETA
jgi:hypothetical protein